MHTITKIIKITNGRKREEVDKLEDLTGMTVVQPYPTIIQGRSAIVEEWYDEDSFNGWERITITLLDGEL